MAVAIAREPIRTDPQSLAEMGFAIGALWLMTGAVTRLFSDPGSMGVRGAETPAVQIIGIFVYLICGVLVGVRLDRYGRGLWVSAVILIPVAFAFASVAWSNDGAISLRRSVALLGTTIFGMYLGVRFNRREFATILFAALGSLILFSVAAAVVNPGFAIHNAAEGQFEHHEGLWRGPFNHKNRLGSIAIVSVVLTLALWRLIPVASVAKAVFVAVAVVVVLKSGSATATVQTVLFGGAILGHRYFSKLDLNLRAAALFFGGAALILLISFSDQIIAAVLATIGRTPEMSGRSNIWAAAALGGMAHPWLGGGYSQGWESGTNLIALRMNGRDVGHPHSGFLNHWLDLGFIGLALLVPAWISFVQRSVRIANYDYNFYVFSIYFFALYMLTNYVYSALMIYQDIFWVLLVALFVQNHRIVAESHGRSFAPFGFGRTSTAVAAMPGMARAQLRAYPESP